MARTPSSNLPLFTEEQVQERLHILLEGISQYNDGYFFDAHEIWEELWMQSPWPLRKFLQGIIQVAAAFVHFVRHEYPGTVRLLGHAHDKLVDFTPRYMGVDTQRLVDEVAAVRDELLELGPERFEDLPPDRLPKINLLPTEPGFGGKV